MAHPVEILSELIQKRLQEKLPGFEYQRKMSPEPRKYLEDNHPVKKAAVLILLFPLNGLIHLALIKRTLYDGPHSGQISFPGGMYEEKDINLSETAIRETMEETGINRDEITLLGNLTSIQIPISKIEVLPLVGYSKHTPIFKINKKEVERMILVPLKDLANNDIISTEYREINTCTYTIPYYNYNGDKIWGATAMILCEFLRIIEEPERDGYSLQY
ncbi:MAG: CoA pyrophosphatase [Bacteroidales bacterium]|nr:CoA pyrophosphatase [Bacteroidales bacterium]MCF8389943.1 CoA pyrophosphatase [Bacteroidales bacterium]